MYEVDSKDKVLKLDSLPPSCCGAPLPVVLKNEQSTLIAYVIQNRIQDWDRSSSPRLVEPDSDAESIAIVRFVFARAIMFGPPNDEAFHGHPLASRGLKPYGVFEVLHSSWIRKLERMNSVHDRHRPERYQSLRHFVLSFHDSTFECVAEDLKLVEVFRGSMTQALARMTSLLAESDRR